MRHLVIFVLVFVSVRCCYWKLSKRTYLRCVLLCFALVWFGLAWYGLSFYRADNMVVGCKFEKMKLWRIYAVAHVWLKAETYSSVSNKWWQGLNKQRIKKLIRLLSCIKPAIAHTHTLNATAWTKIVPSERERRARLKNQTKANAINVAITTSTMAHIGCFEFTNLGHCVAYSVAF